MLACRVHSVSPRCGYHG